MNVLNKIIGAFKKAPQNYGVAGDSYRYWFGGTPSGVTVSDRSAMQLTAVSACIKILSESMAALPLHVYEYDRSGKRVRAIEHPLYHLLHDEPNSEMTSFVFRETLMTHLLIHGNAYAQIVRNGFGQIVGLYPLLPNRMTVGRDENQEIYYDYRTQSDESSKVKTRRLSRRDVLHIPALGFDGLIGYSPLAMAKNSVGIALACDEFGARFFRNGATPSGVLEYPGAIKEIDKVRDSWQAAFGGVANSGKVAILENGMKYSPISIPPEQAQFLETRKYQVNEICRIYRVPPHMVGDLEKSSFSNIEQQSLEFVKYTLDPWVVRWEQAMCKALFSAEEKKRYFVGFNLDGLMRGDYVSRMNGYAVARQNGWMSANDIRELENMDKIPSELGGDRYLCNGNMVDIGEAGKWNSRGE